MFAGKKSAQIREILISESAWEEMTCLFAPSLVETVYAARSALYFWDQNNLFSSADNGISRAVSDSITRIVNLYDNHYEDRHNNLIRFLQEGIFDEIF